MKIKTNRELDSFSPAKTGKKQLILGQARGIDGRKHKHGGLVGRGIFQIPGGKGKPHGIRKVPKDTYKRKKK